MKRLLVIVLAVATGCVATSHTRVLVAYEGAQPPDNVALEAVNATGHALPLPRPGLIEEAVRVVTQQPPPESSIVDAFVDAATEHLTKMQIGVAAPAGLTLRIRLLGWDVNNATAAGGVAVVSAEYQLLDEAGGVRWAVEQDGLRIRLGGPNLSRYEIARITRTCVALAFASLRPSTTATPHS